MKEIILGTSVGTLVILGAISLCISLTYKQTVYKNFFVNLGDKETTVKVFFALITCLLKVLLIGLLFYIYRVRADFNFIHFVISYGAITLLIVLVLVFMYALIKDKIISKLD